MVSPEFHEGVAARLAADRQAADNRRAAIKRQAEMEQDTKEYTARERDRLRGDCVAVAAQAVESGVAVDATLYQRGYLPARRFSFFTRDRDAPVNLVVQGWKIDSSTIHHEQVTDDSEDGGGRVISAAHDETRGLVLRTDGLLHWFEAYNGPGGHTQLYYTQPSEGQNSPQLAPTYPEGLPGFPTYRRGYSDPDAEIKNIDLAYGYVRGKLIEFAVAHGLAA